MTAEYPPPPSQDDQHHIKRDWSDPLAGASPSSQDWVVTAGTPGSRPNLRQ